MPGRPVPLIIEELALAAVEQDIDADSLAEMVREAAILVDIQASGETK